MSSELLLMLLMAAGSSSSDLATLLDPADYFKQRSIEVRIDKMMELAATESKDGSNQIAQLLALRVLGDEATKLKDDAKYADYRRILEQIAEGTKAKDKQGFAKEHARRSLLRIDGKEPMAAPAKGKWREEALGWFPSSATLLFAIDTQRSQPAGGDRELHAMLAKLTQLIPVKERMKVYDFIDQLGNIQIQRVAVAYTDNPKNVHEGEFMVRITGKADQARLIKVLTGLGLEAKERKGRKGETYTMLTDPEPRKGMPAMLVLEHDFIITGVTGRGDHLGVLSKLLDVRDSNKGGVMEGDLKADIQRVPEKASAFLVGLPPADMRKGAPFPIPARVFAHMQRAPKAMDVQLEASFENAEQVKTFVQAVFDGRTSALDALKKAEGRPLPIPGLDLAPIQNMLESLQVEGKGDTAKLRVMVPIQTTLPALLLFEHIAPPVPKEEKK